MNKKTPREGARWGEDPAPEPVVQQEPQISEAFLTLCRQYGEENTKKAIQVHFRIKHEYPHLAVMQREPVAFAADILEIAKQQMARTANDSRSHSMPETLDIMADHLGGILVQNPNWTRVEDITISYGDEHKGTAAKKAAKTAENKKGIAQISVIILIPSLIIGGLAAKEPGGYAFAGGFFLTAAVVGVGLIVLTIIGAIGELFE